MDEPTLSILEENRDILERSTEVLLEKETLEKRDLHEFPAGIRPEPTAQAAA